MNDEIEHELEQLKKAQSDMQRRLEEIEAYVSRLQEAARTYEQKEGYKLEDTAPHSELSVIMEAINTTESRMEAAKKLGISPRTLKYKLAHARSIAMNGEQP